MKARANTALPLLKLAATMPPVAGFLFLSLSSVALAQRPQSPRQQNAPGAKTTPQPVAVEYAGAIRARYAELLKGVDFDSEIARLSQSIMINPNVVRFYISRGNLYRLKGDYLRAAQDLDWAVAMTPKLAVAYNGRGLNSLWRGETDKAIADFGRAIDLDPGDSLARKNHTEAVNERYSRTKGPVPISLVLLTELVQQGNERMAKRDPTSAINFYTRALAVDTKSLPLLSLRAEAYIANRDYKNGLADFDRLVAADPKNAETFNRRGVAHKAAGDIELALSDYDRALDLDPNYTAALNNRGVIYSGRREYDRAIAEFDRVLAITPNSAVALLNRGRVHHARREFDRAIEDFDKALAIEPSNPTAVAYKNAAIQAKTGGIATPGQNPAANQNASAGGAALSLSVRSFQNSVPDLRRTAEGLLQRREWDKAIAEADRALSADGNDGQAYLLRGFAFQMKRDFTKALADYDKAAALRPNDSNVPLNRAKMHGANSDFTRAISDFDLALQLDPKNADAYVGRAFALSRQGKIDQALADFDRAIDINPRSADAFSGRGFEQARKGRIDNALADIERAIAINPQHAQAYANRGYALSMRGEHDRALAALDRALELNAGNATALAFRALNYIAKKEPAKALGDLDRAIAIDSKLEMAYGLRGALRVESKEFTGAIEDLDRAIALKPDDIAALFNRAAAHEGAGEGDLALSGYKTVMTTKASGLADLRYQVLAKRRVDALSEKRPCDDPGKRASQACL